MNMRGLGGGVVGPGGALALWGEQCRGVEVAVEGDVPVHEQREAVRRLGSRRIVQRVVALAGRGPPPRTEFLMAQPGWSTPWGEPQPGEALCSDKMLANRTQPLAPAKDAPQTCFGA